MKRVLTAAFLLVLLVVALALNSAYVVSASYELASAAEISPSAARECFEKHSALLSLTVHNRLFEEAELSLIAMEAFAFDAFSPEFTQAKRAFLHCCREMREDENLLPQNIF